MNHKLIVEIMAVVGGQCLRKLRSELWCWWFLHWLLFKCRFLMTKLNYNPCTNSVLPMNKKHSELSHCCNCKLSDWWDHSHYWVGTLVIYNSTPLETISGGLSYNPISNSGAGAPGYITNLGFCGLCYKNSRSGALLEKIIFWSPCKEKI